MIIRNLSVLAYANGFTLWHYKSADNLSNTNRDNYFVEAWELFRPGDMVMISAADGARIVVVSQADNEAVAVAALI